MYVAVAVSVIRDLSALPPYDVVVPKSVVLLHGFAGTRRAWDGVSAFLQRERYRPLAIDLPGHGEAANGERPITFAACLASVLSASPPRFDLCGYSLGGRVALHVALAEPTRVRRLVLVSSTPGIEDAAERAERRVADHRLAAELESQPLEQFIASWRSQPLFAGEPAEVTRLAAEDHRRNRPDALAEALRGIGTGEMAQLWTRLQEIDMPVAVVVGERDAKFTAIGRRIVERLPHGRLITIPGGHNLPLESPAALARVVLDRG